MLRALALTVILLLMAGSSAPGHAQTIPIRTVPVASGDQFLMLPSATLAMGGAHLAVDDSLGDVWSNPAKGVFVAESSFLGSPTFYSISRGGGGGRSFPVAGVFSGSPWFGGAALALQQIDNQGDDDGFFAAPVRDVCCWGCCGPTSRTLSERYGRNLYAQAYLGRRIGPEWSLGVGGAAARLGAVDGVDLLYSGSDRIDQSGDLSDVRVGAYRSGARDRWALLAFHRRLSMTHEVSWSEWIWDESLMTPVFQRRVDVHHDETRTWGGRVGWDRSLETPGWRVGASATINYKDHPKIPNYTIQNIPRDPGTTWAYEAAVGFSRSFEGTTFALDVALQPIWSETWQEADAQDVLDSGQRLSVGDRSIENDFFFTNVMIRTGLGHRFEDVDLQAGLSIQSYAYELEQVDLVDRSFRRQDEAWIEWSPSFGAVFRFEALELRYTGRVTTGTGLPGTARLAGPGLESPGADAGTDFILAPDGPLTLQDVRVTTHQLAVRIPIR